MSWLGTARHGLAGRGAARLGRARQGMARQGEARQGEDNYNLVKNKGAYKMKSNARINFEISPEFKKLIKAAAARRGTTIKDAGIKLYSAWLKIKEGGKKC